MKLRTQLLLASLLLLTIPWVGWQGTRQLYLSLQEQRRSEQQIDVARFRQILESSTALAQALSTTTESAPAAAPVYAQAIDYPLSIDGYADDWREIASPQVAIGDRISLKAASHESRLYLLIDVDDDEVVFHTLPTVTTDYGESDQPELAEFVSNGDALALRVVTGRADTDEFVQQTGLLRAVAPGALVAFDLDKLEDSRKRWAQQPPTALGALPRKTNWQAAWVNTRTGFQLEISLPSPASGDTLALQLTDVDSLAEGRGGNQRKVLAFEQARMTLFGASDGVADLLDAWSEPGTRLRVFDAERFLLADINRLYERPEGATLKVLDSILFRLFAWFVAGDLPLLPDNVRGANQQVMLNTDHPLLEAGVALPSSERYVTPENDRVMGTMRQLSVDKQAAQPGGYLLYEENEEHASAYAGGQLARLFSLLLLVSLLASAGLFLFALVLSFRIRRLANQTAEAVGRDGRIASMPSATSRDEIGDLSRQLSASLGRSASYNDYLEDLSSRLSHELRTPLSVVDTSLDNLTPDEFSDNQRLLVNRAKGGVDQLAQIVTSLVESTRLEQTVQRAQFESLSVARFLDLAVQDYRQLYPDCQVVLSGQMPGQAERQARDRPSHDDRRATRREQSSPGLETVPVSDAVVRVAPLLLRQALDKLMNNAVDFSIDGRILVVADFDKERRTGRILVGNCGDALEPEQLRNLFDTGRSQRPDSPLQSEHLGLGLQIVRLVAEVHGGQGLAYNDSPWVFIGLEIGDKQD